MDVVSWLMGLVFSNDKKNIKQIVKYGLTLWLFSLPMIAHATATMSLPATSSTGSYTLSWSNGTQYVKITESKNGAAEVSLAEAPNNLSSSGSVNLARPNGTYKYFIYESYNSGGGTIFYPTSSANKTIVVSSNASPTISSIANLSVYDGTTTSGPIAFTVNDAETAGSSLNVTAVSSNTTLVPNANLTLVNNGNSRTISVQPVAGVIGSSVITVSVSDGVNPTV
ncbi:MAG TPA: hypothetical protein VIM59_01240, partial [Cellvibrio sp.]